MIPMVSVVGTSNSGKTTLIEKLIAELVRRGYRVATIKHNLHGFSIDHPGKDSWRHKRAGAKMTILASPTQVAVVEDVSRDQTFEELAARYVHDVDLILTEGHKRNPHPKIEVWRAVQQRELLSKPEDGLIAVASDRPLDAGVPCLDIDDAGGLADLIVSQFLDGNGH